MTDDKAQETRARAASVVAVGVNAAARPTFTEVGHLTAFVMTRANRATDHRGA